MTVDEMLEALKTVRGWHLELNCHLWAFAIGGTVEYRLLGEEQRPCVIGKSGNLIVQTNPTGNAYDALRIADRMHLDRSKVLEEAENVFLKEQGCRAPGEVLELFPPVICRVALEMKKEEVK